MERRKRRRTSTRNEPQSLIQASAYPGMINCVFGVILDATGHYKTDDSIDYVTRLKVIDHTLNSSKMARKENLEGFVYVFIYSESVEEAPKIDRVGDIICLNNFEFDSYHRVIKAKFHKKKSSWRIFDGRKNANLTSIISSSGKSETVEASEKNHLHQLRKWGETYFSTRSLYSMNWFKRAFPSNPDPKEIYELVDVDIVVKLVTEYSIRVKENLYQKMVFVDKLKNLYFCEKKGILSGINKGDVMKLRSITLNLHNKQYKITFSSYSNFMLLQKSFRDTKEVLDNSKSIKYDKKKLQKQFFEEMHLDKRSKKQLGPNTLVYSNVSAKDGPLNQELVKQNFLESFPILKNFSYEVEDLNRESVKKSSKKKKTVKGSAILLKHENLELTDLKSLAKSLSKPCKKSEGDLFRVRASIKTIENSDFNSNFKIFSKESNKTWELDTKKKKFDKDEKIIFYNVFGLKDESLTGKDAPVPVYLITYNENPKYVYDLWGQLPDTLSIKDWLSLKKGEKEVFERSLKELKKTERVYDLVLQKVNADGNRVYLKLVDSIFWFTTNE